MAINEYDIEKIRALIKNGVKTSEIVAMGNWSVEDIKKIKSQELEAQKQADRDRVKNQSEEHMAHKKELHHTRFLKRLGIDPESEAARAKELADAHFAQEQKEKDEAAMKLVDDLAARDKANADAIAAEEKAKPEASQS